MGRPAKPPRRVGRPPAGARSGERVKDYPQISVRLPPDALVSLNALSVVFGQPQWRVMHNAIQNIVENLSAKDRELFIALVRKKAPEL